MLVHLQSENLTLESLSSFSRADSLKAPETHMIQIRLEISVWTCRISKAIIGLHFINCVCSCKWKATVDKSILKMGKLFEKDCLDPHKGYIHTYTKVVQTEAEMQKTGSNRSKTLNWVLSLTANPQLPHKLYLLGTVTRLQSPTIYTWNDNPDTVVHPVFTLHLWRNIVSPSAGGWDMIHHSWWAATLEPEEQA